MKKIACVLAAVLAVAILYWYFFIDMGRLPEGELMAASASPGGEYTVNLYLCRGGATTADSVRGEVVSEGKSRNIYWQYKEDRCEIYWESNTIANINGISLDVRKDAYDWRRSTKTRTA